jgi:hypothetical protein
VVSSARMRGISSGGAIVILGAVLGLSGSACTPGAPPTPLRVDAAVAPLPGPPTIGSDSGAAPLGSAASAGDAGAPDDAGSKRTTGSSVDAGDPGSLPQTRDRPAAASPELDARIAALWDGIATDDPERAMPFFFPVSAYEQVKAIPSPASDWRRRLVAAYKRDIRGLHKRLGEKAEDAKFVRLEVANDRARWVEPDEESNKLGYWRVYGTRIVYQVDGRERGMEISSLISWRGEWYVVHLTGFN